MLKSNIPEIAHLEHSLHFKMTKFSCQACLISGGQIVPSLAKIIFD